MIFMCMTNYTVMILERFLAVTHLSTHANDGDIYFQLEASFLKSVCNKSMGCSLRITETCGIACQVTPSDV